jgi:amidohydrolase
VDAIMASAHVLTTLQTIISREIDPLEPVVITMGTINGGYRHNVIADEVNMTGTIRTLNEDIRKSMPERFDRIIKGVCESLRCEYELDYSLGIPSVVNDVDMTDIVKEAAVKLLGEENAIQVDKPSMGGEDFCYFSQAVPSSFFRLSARNEEKGCTYPGHHPKYNFDEESIPYGIAMFAKIVINYLNK